ncbi:MAG: hypothetical protein FXV79_00800 [Candidatus Thioglobus sp.]|nr:MAG: hypothetical protein FXV79_00800 [Candidatus Thioglobus sp.]
MIKILLSIIVILALIGGAIQLKSTDEEWSLVVNKSAALSSVKNGVLKIYDFAADTYKGEKSAKEPELSVPATPVEK